MAPSANGQTTNGQSNGKPAAASAAPTPTVDISVALKPNAPEQVPGLIQEIAAAGQNLNFEDSASRLQLLEKARDLVRALEAPRETMIKHLWAQVC